MAGRINFTLVDNSGEKTGVKMYIPTLDATNVVTYTDDTLGGNLGDMRLAIAALTLCNFEASQVLASQNKYLPSLPTDKNAQRETKMLVNYADDVTGKKYSFTIPGIDRDLVATTGTDNVDLTITEVATLVTEFETNCVSELGNAVTVISAKLVGRNN